MAPSPQRFGLSCALATPFDESGEVAVATLAGHARWCLDHGCDSVTAFGTTGEGASLGLADRRRVLQALVDGGIDGGRVLGAVAASTSDDALDQARLLVEAGCRGILLTPPFYFKGVPDEGLFAWFSSVLARLGPVRGVLLYNIPSVTAVEISVELVGRLRAAHPEAIAGVKDSSGNWAYTRRLLEAHRDLAILIGDERHLAAGVRLGAQGAISGMANVCPDRLVPLVREGRDDRGIAGIVEELLTRPVTPAVKALIAHRTGDAGWRRVRPPLAPIPEDDAARLGAAFDAAAPSGAP